MVFADSRAARAIGAGKVLREQHSTRERAFWIYDAAVTAAIFHEHIAGASSEMVPYAFPGKDTSAGGGYVSVTLGDAHKWDRLLHEYGHIVAQEHDFHRTNLQGREHDAAFNLRGRVGDHPPENSLQLAFAEGWGNFFSMVVQDTLSVPAIRDFGVLDRLYEGTHDPEANYDGFSGAGEDEENTVMQLLWDLYDPKNEAVDRIHLGFEEIFSILKDNNIRTLDGLWDYLFTTSASDPDRQFDYGAIFEAHNVSPVAVGTWVNGVPVTSFSAVDPSPTFVWRVPQGHSDTMGGQYQPVGDLLNTFDILFYDGSGQLILQVVPLQSDLGSLGDHRIGYVLHPDVWDSLMATPGTVRWAVRGGWDAGGSGMYLSTYREFLATE